MAGDARMSRRRARRFGAPALAVALLLLLAAARTRAAPLVASVESVGCTVADMDRSVAFYSTVLGFQPVADVEVGGEDYARLEGVPAPRLRVVRLRLGDETVELTQYLTPRGRPVPDDSRSNDRWFQHVAVIVSDMDRAYAWLRQRGIQPVSAGPQRLPDWNPQAGGIRAFYFKDPDGHVLEILQFPPGKGAAKWHVPSDRLFLGIDHTAIVVADTDASLRFYRDQLGLAVAGESENYGVEQERLSAVAQAHLRITGLRAGAGPGIELLEYLAPRDGRPLPPRQRANDLAHWQTRLRTADVAAAAQALQRAGAGVLSDGVVDLAHDELGFDVGVLVGDPDGHALQVVQP
jgi:catechol 2,3-dioxygenase-like lactoylglutathione lyase family enzyme